MAVRVWGQRERQGLKRVRRSLGLSQDQFAQLLHERYDVARVDQSTVSGWELQTRPGADHLAAILALVQSEDVDIIDAASTELSRDDLLTGAEFQGLVRELTAEPLLGDMQRSLIDAVIKRIGSGHPFSKEDLAALAAAAKTLRVPDEAWLSLLAIASREVA